jgi:peptidyl-prolyl cis-trans isomerase B (cyclophilin B)
MTSRRGKRRKERSLPRTGGPERPGSTRTRRSRPPARQRSGLPVVPLVIGGAVVLGVLLVLAYVAGLLPGVGPAATPGRSPAAVGPPDATPLANPPAEPAGDGTRATIATEVGDIVLEIHTDSSPVAAQNFINLAEAGFYEGVVFHRIVPGFMIQGGDPEGTGMGGPGYGIPDEPVVGDYVRGTVAMARSSLPNSQGSQFFIVVEDSPFLEGGGYAIFGRVVSGMEVADQIVAGPRTGPQNDQAVEPVAMQRVTIERP